MEAYIMFKIVTFSMKQKLLLIIRKNVTDIKIRRVGQCRFCHLV